MKKVRVNITLDDDLSKFLKGFSKRQKSQTGLTPSCNLNSPSF